MQLHPACICVVKLEDVVKEGGTFFQVTLGLSVTVVSVGAFFPPFLPMASPLE